MGSIRSLVVLTAALALASCNKARIYGPPGEERLEAAVSEGNNSEGGEVGKIRCVELQQKLKECKLDDRNEEDRVEAMTSLFLEAQKRFEQIEAATARNPDLLYGTQAEAVKTGYDECRAALADTRSDLDRYVREVCEQPLLQDMHGNKNVARLDFSSVRAAIEALQPDDKDALFGKLDAAEKKAGATPTKPRRRGGK